MCHIRHVAQANKGKLVKSPVPLVSYLNCTTLPSILDLIFWISICKIKHTYTSLKKPMQRTLQTLTAIMYSRHRKEWQNGTEVYKTYHAFSSVFFPWWLIAHMRSWGRAHTADAGMKYKHWNTDSCKGGWKGMIILQEDGTLSFIIAGLEDGIWGRPKVMFGNHLATIGGEWKLVSWQRQCVELFCQQPSGQGCGWATDWW